MALQILFAASMGLSVLTAAALVVWLWQSSSRPAQGPEISKAWFAGLSVERYKPMLRLLDEQDFVFLKSQPGFTGAMADRLREHRYRMFLAYLESLRADFDRVMAGLKSGLARADRDRSRLACTLICAQFSFGFASRIAAVRAHLWRKGYGKADASRLLRLFRETQLQLRSLALPLLVA